MESVCPILERSTLVDETSFGWESWSIVRCKQTGFVFLSNPPAYSQLESEFAWEETSAVEKKRRQAAEPVFSRVSDVAKAAKLTAFPRRNKIASLACSVVMEQSSDSPTSVLDIGCGDGSLLLEMHHRLSQAGRQVRLKGIEVSKELAASSNARIVPLGGKVVSANALEGISKLPHDSIHLALMSSFLEHECRPLSLLRNLRNALAPNGAVVLKVPNFACWNRLIRSRKWCGFRFPDHVNYFTPTTLRRLTEEAGFKIARQNLRDKFPLSDNMYAVLKKA